MATKCLDVGVSITTRNLNIVCFLKDRVDFLQAIGRKRVISGERVRLLIPKYSRKDVQAWISRARNKEREIREICESYPDGSKAWGTNIPFPVLLENGNYRHNSFTFDKLHVQISDWCQIDNELSDNTDNESMTIARHILSWMELDQTIPDNEASNRPSHEENEIRSQLEEVIQPHMYESMDEEQFRKFCNNLKTFDCRKDKRKDRSGISTRTVNTIFTHYMLPLYVRKGKADGHDVYRILNKAQEDNKQ